MKRKIKVKGHFGYYDNDYEIVMTDKKENLQIEFEGLPDKGQFFFCSLIGHSESTKQIENGIVTIEPKSGTLKSYIEVRVNDIVNERIQVEDLKITKINHTFEAIPQIEEFKRENAELKAKVETLTANVEVLTQIVNLLAETEIGG